MTNTKVEIVALLKRNGGHSVKELAAALHLAAVTVRQHLTHLQRDGLIAAQQRPNGYARPSYVFRLTAKGHAASFPRRSDRLVELLVREISLLEGEELTGLSKQAKVSLVLQRVAFHLADEFTPFLRGWRLQERVAFVTEVMHADGGFAEWEAAEGGFEIRDFNCLFHRFFQSENEVCEWHRSFLSRVLGTEVRVTPCPNGSAQCCRFVIEATADVTAKAG
ncbi:MAG: winged helix-turn-helix transcriptional regulator [Dehalococcoidia bacterium]